MRMEIEDLKLRSSTNKMEGTLRDGSPSGKFGIDSAEFQRIKVENDLLKDKCRRLEEAANVMRNCLLVANLELCHFSLVEFEKIRSTWRIRSFG